MKRSSEAKTTFSSVPVPERLVLVLSFFCLEAPLVATGWSILLIRPDSVSDRHHLLAGLFLATWGIYLFDRLYDTRPGATILRQSARHRFARKYRTLLYFLFGVSAIGTIVCTLAFETTLPRGAVFVGFLVLLYFLVFRGLKQIRSISLLPCKEILIAVCFTEAVCLAADHRWQSDSWIPPVVFFLLVLSNCNLISFREADEDRLADQSAFFHTPKRSAIVWIFTPILLALALSLSIIPANPQYSAGLSGALAAVFLLLTWTRAKPALTHAYADLSLCSPFLFLGITLLFHALGQATR